MTFSEGGFAYDGSDNIKKQIKLLDEVEYEGTKGVILGIKKEFDYVEMCDTNIYLIPCYERYFGGEDNKDFEWIWEKDIKKYLK